MNTDKATGKFDQIAGKVKQKVGEAVGNQKLANAGVAEQIKGSAKETWGHAKDTAAAVHDDAQARARVHGEDKAHNLRDSVAATAQNVKNSVTEKLDNIKRDHNR